MRRKKNPGSGRGGKATKRARIVRRPQADFDRVLSLIQSARSRSMRAVNGELIDLYWSIGEHISDRVLEKGWGKGTVMELSEFIAKKDPGARGFSASNLWRMMQFFETYRGQAKLAPLVRELSWTHNLLIMSRSKRNEEREFYLRMCSRERWGKRVLDRQLSGGLFERTILSPAKLSAPLRVLRPEAAEIFKDSYLVEFLNLPRGHSEGDLHRGLVEKLKTFLIELGRDFCFVGSYYTLQVGGKDFELDLLFFHRGLNCLVAFDLKIEEFQPEHLGKMEFYLEALDRDVKKAHERPSIGVLLCATKDREVVEYSLSRAMSPAVVAEYHTRLPDKEMLESKLREFYQMARGEEGGATAKGPVRSKRQAAPAQLRLLSGRKR